MQIGDILNGTYQLERPLGVGGQARVWQARHLRLPRHFAIKECPLTGGDRREVAERRVLFERERDILAALSHPGHAAIPKISDFWEEPDSLFIVLDLVEGETLIELLSRRGRVTMTEAINWGRQICEVLTYLHSWRPPIIYRDLSPDNVILYCSGQLHLIDFGIARTFKPGQIQNTTSLGKAGYASPEHLEGGKSQTEVRSDLYTLGALLFPLLTGQEPIPVVDRLKQRAGLQGGRALVMPRSLNWHLSPAMEHVILCAMELEPGQRYRNAEEMARALAACDPPRSRQRCHRRMNCIRRASEPGRLTQPPCGASPPRRPSRAGRRPGRRNSLPLRIRRFVGGQHWLCQYHQANAARVCAATANQRPTEQHRHASGHQWQPGAFAAAPHDHRPHRPAAQRPAARAAHHQSPGLYWANPEGPWDRQPQPQRLARHAGARLQRLARHAGARPYPVRYAGW